MAGRGSRFSAAGYQLPKMLIESHGQTLLEWSVDSLPLDLCSNLIFVGLVEHNVKYALEDKIKALYSNRNFTLSFLWLNDVTRGQAETVLLTKHLIDQNKDLLIFNIDTYFSSLSLKTQLLRSDIDGVLGAFKSNQDRFSYALVNSETGYIEQTAEKIVISDNALTGLYHFKKASDFFLIAEEHVSKNITSKGEFYIAPMYTDLIKRSKKFVIDLCNEHWILGTPEELKLFDNNFRP